MRRAIALNLRGRINSNANLSYVSHVKTDSIFYRLFQEFPSIFFELIGNSPQTAAAYQFSSIEIKQTAFRVDGVFLPTQEEQNPIYFIYFSTSSIADVVQSKDINIKLD